MKPIILASASAQRKKLLRYLGIDFKVRPSHAKEKTKITTTCSSLVKDNALIKAQDVASRLKQGIVIGADSVVYVGHKTIIGKPKDLKDAKRILKILFAQPHWVYTGVAVIDVSSGRKVIDYEKTKIFMMPLSDKEIDRYHTKIPPCDKAGGFDIEGWGSVFIHRIEGCYTNVIGLPMARLFKMLKKIDVALLTVLLCFYLGGCVTEYNLATQQEETLLYSTEKEIHLGDSVSKKLESHYKMNTDVDVNEKVNRILSRLAAVSDRKDLVYFVKVIDDEDVVNAVSLPGGYIYIFKGLMDKVKTDDQLASVIAHELGHITAKHGIKRLQASYGALFLQLASTQASGQIAGGVNLALNSIFMEYSQKDELEADRLSVKYLQEAGYDPQGIIEFLNIIKQENAKEPRRYFSYWRTHPYVAQRIANANQEINGKLEFKDYLNLTQ